MWMAADIYSRACLGALKRVEPEFVCGIGTGPDDLKNSAIPNVYSRHTVASVIDFFKTSGTQLDAIGIGSFGDRH